MRINGSRLKSIGLPSAGDAPRPAPLAREVVPVERNAAEVSDYLPSGDLARLTALAAQEPESRPEALADAAGRLAEGYYLTPESASRTAEALLNAVD